MDSLVADYAHHGSGSICCFGKHDPFRSDSLGNSFAENVRLDVPVLGCLATWTTYHM